MAFDEIGLSKLLNAMQGTPAQQTKLLREDIRREIQKKIASSEGGGGDFYGPFWADVKRHVAGEHDLRQATPARIANNYRRERLYPLLQAGFLRWWDTERALHPGPVKVVEASVKGRHEIEGCGTVKVENTLAYTFAGGPRTVVQAYFCEDPSLSAAAARLGLWLMSQCIKTCSISQLRLLDVLEGRSFSIVEAPLQGDEEDVFRLRYSALSQARHQLKAEYA